MVAFLKACIDEDEAIASAAGADEPARQWTGSDNGYPGSGCVRDGHGETIVYDEGTPSTEQALHIGRHDPARVLAEVAAKRAILAKYAPVAKNDGLGEPEYACGWADGLGMAVRALAAAGSDHPGYDESWLP